MDNVVITGYGLLTPMGNNVEEFERRMFAGDSGITDVRRSRCPSDFPVHCAGIIDDTGLPSAEDLGPYPEIQSKFVRYALITLKQTLSDLPAGLPIDGMIYTSPSGVYFELAMETLKDFDHCDSLLNLTRTEYAPQFLAKYLEDNGYGSITPERMININSACASGIHIIGLAYQYLKTGRWKRCLVGGVDGGASMSTLMNYYLLNALTTADVLPQEASRPFSLDRSGFVKSEAVVSLLLEARQSAEERGARILAEVCGFGLTTDAYRLTDGREDNLCVIRAMEQAIETAGIRKEDIDYINAHGTSTSLGDRLETMAIKKVFGDRSYDIPISSLKSQIGHPTLVSGAVETIACALMLQRQKLAPTINMTVRDPECDLDYVPNKSRDAKVTYILKNAFGFGGQNACIVLKKAA